MMKKMTFVITHEHDGKTVRHMVLKVMKISAGAYSRLKFQGGIMLDGEQAFANQIVKKGQILQVCFPEAEINIPNYSIRNQSFAIVYEDDDYYVIDKPAGMATMHSVHKSGDTLETELYHYLGCPDGYVFRPVNRLDKGTSGLMAVAKHAHAQQLLQKQLHKDTFVREYTALCKGCLSEKEGVIRAPIGKAESGIKRQVKPDGKEAVTAYRVLEYGKHASLVHLRLYTGRTHQIRVHMAHLGCPVWGDYVYGQADENFPGCFALHSSSICFYQPITGKKVQIISKVPDMWYNLLRK